ncbi:MAG: serine hydrolase domain-containing protein [Planctomycetota bacterium]|jgi:CubicO group peptidase (beta-lactamase class C family)
MKPSSHLNGGSINMPRETPCISSLLLLLVLFLAFSTFCYSQTDANAESIPDNPRTIEELSARIETLLRKHEIPGVGIALVSEDSILWMGGFGLANVETGELVTENTLFRVGSCTKSFLGLGFLKLIDEGKIDINTPAIAIVPEIAIDNPWRDTHPVRIVHLLEHTAGFDDIHMNSLYNEEDPEMPLQKALQAKAQLRVVRWQPGTRRAYSSPGYTLAGYILEKITGQRYEDYLKEVILEPVGMTTSTLRLTDECKQLLSTGYGDNYEPFPFFDGFDRPASSLNSSTREMALFVQFLLKRGRVDEEQVISEASIDRLGKPSTTIASKAGLRGGYSFGVGVRFQDGFKWYGHSGGGPGFIAKYYYTKESGLGYAVLSNTFNISEFEELSRLVQRYLIRDIDPPSKPSAQVSADQFEKFSGYYELLSSRQELVRFLDILLAGITISFENDTLYQKEFMSGKEALIPVSPNMFRKSSEPEASRIFTMSPEGNRVYATLGSYYEETGIWKIYVYRALVFGSLAMMVSAIIYMFFWIPAHLYKKLKRKEKRSIYIRMRVIPLLAILSLVLGIVVVSNQSLVTIGHRTIHNLIFFASTVLFAGFSFLSLVFAIISFNKPVKKIASVYAVFLSLACLGMTLYLSYWGVIGLRLWAY